MATGYLDLKYLPPPYLNPPETSFLGLRMLNQYEIEDSCKAHSKINRKVLAVYAMAQMTWFSPGMVLFGVRTMSDIIWGNVPQKTP